MKRARVLWTCIALAVVGLSIASCGGGATTDPQGPGPGKDGGGGGGDGGTTTTLPDGEVINNGGGEGGTTPPDCFSLADSKALTFEVVEDYAPPAISTISGDYIQSSLTYPASYYATTTIASLVNPTPATATKLKRAYSMSANRCFNMTGITQPGGCTNTVFVRGNSYPNVATSGGTNLLAAFSSYARANACTTIQAGKALGIAEGTLQSEATAAGVTLFDNADHTTLPTNAAKKTVTVGATQSTFLVDLCVTETQAEAADTNGIVLTFEPQDLRKGTDATAYLQSLDGVVTGAGKELIVTSLDLTGAGAKGSGIDAADVHAEIDAVQGFAPIVGTGAAPADATTGAPAQPYVQTAQADYTAQLAILGTLSTAEKAKILLKVNLYEGDGGPLHMDEAQAINGFVTSQGYRGLIILRNGITLGGLCNASDNHNQIMACLTTGQCDGKFGL